jgi:hypothetical protein
MASGDRKHTGEKAIDVVALGLATAILATSSLVPPCAHELLTASGATVPMRCHWTFQIVRLLGLAAVVVALLLVAARKGSRRNATAEFLVLLAALVVAVTQPWMVGLCGRDEMACHTTARWVWLWAALLAVAGLAARWLGKSAQVAAVVPDPWEQAAGGREAVK